MSDSCEGIYSIISTHTQRIRLALSPGFEDKILGIIKKEKKIKKTDRFPVDTKKENQIKICELGDKR
jgi:hypothetical protein